MTNKRTLTMALVASWTAAACGTTEGLAGAASEGPSDFSNTSADAGAGGGAEDEFWDDQSYGAGGAGGGWEEPETPQPDHSGESYQDYGANPFVETAEDRFATFAIDVDTASYTLMRRDVTGGILPVPEGVRVEEYVNFFRYGDAPPAAEDPFPFAIHLETSPSPFGPDLQLMRVNLTGRPVDLEQIKPANLIFLVDVSGSMQSPDKIGLVQYTLSQLTQQLRPSDTIGIVRYAGDVGVALQPTPVEQRERILQAIESLEVGGSTYGEGGLRQAYDLAAEAFREGGINRVVLCTDGDFNVGLTGQDLVDLIVRERERGITLSTLGYGTGNYNDATMEQLADQGNGHYAYIDNMREADRVVKRDLSGTLQVIAKDVKIQVELNPAAVAEYRLVGYENRAVADQDFANDAVDGGEIGAGHQVTAFLELRMAAEAEAANADEATGLATVRVRTKDPDGAQSRETSAEITLPAMGATLDDVSMDFRFGAAVAETAEILRGSPHVEGPPHLDSVLEMARAAAGEDADRLEFVSLVEKIAELMP